MNISELLKEDSNILEAEICDVRGGVHGDEIAISLTVGDSEEQIAEVLENLQEGEKPPTFKAFEILITERQLKAIMDKIKKFKE